MVDALKNLILNIRYRFVSGSAGQFFHWWTEELRNALPARLRARLQYARRRLLLQINVGEFTVLVTDVAGIQELGSFSVEQDAQVLQQQVRELLQQHELSEVGRDLLLCKADILRTEVVMPLAAEANLGQALAYEMDRHTPFQAEDVFSGWRILSRDREAGLLHFELFVTPREPVTQHMELLNRLGLAPTGVDVAYPQEPLGINLLPTALRFRMVNRRARTNWMMGAAAVLLLALIMTQSLWLRGHQLDATQAAIDEVRAEAMAVQQIRKQIEDANEAAGFLETRKIQNGSRVEMFAELTGILPQDTYLDRLSLLKATVQMQGKSDNAQSLIELINASPFFEGASFRGPTRLDTRSGKEIFDLTASVSSHEAG